MVEPEALDKIIHRGDRARAHTAKSTFPSVYNLTWNKLSKTITKGLQASFLSGIVAFGAYGCKKDNPPTSMPSQTQPAQITLEVSAIEDGVDIESVTNTPPQPAHKTSGVLVIDDGIGIVNVTNTPYDVKNAWCEFGEGKDKGVAYTDNTNRGVISYIKNGRTGKLFEGNVKITQEGLVGYIDRVVFESISQKDTKYSVTELKIDYDKDGIPHVTEKELFSYSDPSFDSKITEFRMFGPYGDGKICIRDFRGPKNVYLGIDSKGGYTPENAPATSQIPQEILDTEKAMNDKERGLENMLRDNYPNSQTKVHCVFNQNIEIYRIDCLYVMPQRTLIEYPPSYREQVRGSCDLYRVIRDPNLKKPTTNTKVNPLPRGPQLRPGR